MTTRALAPHSQSAPIHVSTGATEYDPYSAGRLVMLLAVTAGLHYPDASPEEAVAQVANETRMAVGAEAALAVRRAGRDEFALEQVALAMAEMMSILEIAEPLAVGELRLLRRKPLPNPSTPEGQAALYAWVGQWAGGFVGSVIGLLVGSVAAAAGATGAGVAMAGLGAYAGTVLGARHGAGRAPLVAAKELRETKNYATFGALLMPWFGVGPAVGAYIGAKPNPGDARSVLLSTTWPPQLVEAWGETGLTAGQMAEAVVDTTKAAGWSEEEIIAHPRRAMLAANEIWLPGGQLEETGWGEFPEYVENPGAAQPIEIELVMATGERERVPATQVTPYLVVHRCLRRGKACYGITHAPTGQLVAAVWNEKWAGRLAKEIHKFSGPGLASSDVRVVQRAIGGPGMRRTLYLSHVGRQSQEKKPGKFPTYHQWEKTSHELDANPGNPESLKADAAVAAAVGSLVGGLLGAAVGAVVLGGVGAIAGAAAFGAEAGFGGGVVGAIYGIPLGGAIGTIWGAVRQTGRVVGDHPDAGGAKLGAGVGSAFFGPIGAGLGAYVGAPG